MIRIFVSIQTKTRTDISFKAYMGDATFMARKHLSKHETDEMQKI